ncbi:replication initiator protein A [Enterococcus hirae]|nr:replication initiator protein A [Enterococcus hirae]EMF0535594.1 replication initiator protein A [Enterococcus hirae]
MADIMINQLATQNFYQIPQIFMTRTERVRDGEGKLVKKIKYTSDYAQMSNDAKLAYSALYNRCQLSIHSYEMGKQDYVDEHGAVFLIFTVEDLMDLLDKAKGTVIKIKKELKEKKLLREVKQGLNKPNRLYLQLVEANHQIIEEYDTKNQLLKRLDYLGNELFSSEGKENEESKKTAESLEGQGSSNFGRPKNGLQEVQNLNPIENDSSHTEIYDTTNDTNRYEKQSKSIVSEISEKEAIKMGDYPFLTDRTIDLLAHFGRDTKKLIDKIYAAKRIVEKNYADVLAIRYRVIQRLDGELWSQDIEHEVEKFVFKYRTSCHEEKPIQNILGYFYQMMAHFWKMVLLAETSISFSEIQRIKQALLDGELDEKSVIQAIFPDKRTDAQVNQELLYLEKTYGKKSMQEGKKEKDGEDSRNIKGESQRTRDFPSDGCPAVRGGM